ncbi:MAG TPA: glycine cleavage system aminomethyltransferase GcvT [Ignavibacteriales bacterium]|nr:glycine cleavage system aminomethyltransferase GcvT [Ignavibacteriales bacterium]HPD68097.1 glycine cleavage system aminomethyltransferase GcvT [Ignavibacteriales bacterium]HRR18346.1 glycine cleavage system aminomethyltransferase GcvT [Ignavibacteriales bacterium]HRT99175.1 glycine cleavage system aminomethyltransferase GcvT [Ignavibacteriales bacterium]
MKTTRFNQAHKNHGAKLVDFAGYEMPVQYSSIITEHKAVRESAGVFDVSHMGEFFVEGPEAEKFVNYIATNDVTKLFDGKVQYSTMLYENGGIVDDLLVYRFNNQKYMLVVNASNIEKDFEWVTKNNKFDCTITNKSDDYNLLAVQGPNSTKILEKLLNIKIDLEYYTFYVNPMKYKELELLLSRTGYTGEIGYELYFTGNENQCLELWNDLMAAGKEFGLVPAGLGARDSLRLEVGYCLYGNEIDQNTNPLEAGLGWITKLNKENFIGKDALLKVKENGLSRKLVGIISEEKCFPRHNTEVTIDKNKIGFVTSGTVSPILNYPIAMAYVSTEYAKEGTEVNFFIREKEYKAKVVKLPFVKNNAF